MVESVRNLCKQYPQKRKFLIKAAVGCAEQALSELNKAGVKLWNGLPPKVRNKQILKGW
jgi:hypothetical protein